MNYYLYQVLNFNDWMYSRDWSVLRVPERATAVIDASSLEEVFDFTQHCNCKTNAMKKGCFPENVTSWYGMSFDGVFLSIRSTSVGDIIVDPSREAYIVDNVGFYRCPQLDYLSKHRSPNDKLLSRLAQKFGVTEHKLLKTVLSMVDSGLLKTSLIQQELLLENE